ncbi:hypothetical protein [Pseudonocardia zijingensis]|uniref:Glycoside hydrolase family 42 N-terminal domain-containing protein n=1 Tax=Pseudonocardia zijingensis TaxID=153376 RepID=A0ABP3ZIB1_9PSEU
MTSRQAPAILSLALAVLLAGCGARVSGEATVSTQAARPPGPAFGTLLPVLEAAEDEARAGVTAAVVELGWGRFEPADGEFDEDFIRSVRSEIAELRAAGRTITLDLAIHYAPDWLLEDPDSRLVDDRDNTEDGPNLIFNQRVRGAALDYFRHVAEGIDLDDVQAIRLGAGWYAEVFYPDSGHYWAFDDNAQNGPDLPRSLRPNPAPGWHPGTDDLSPDRVREWADWYVGALADVVAWQMDAWTRLGYRNAFEVMTPGSGVRPRQYEEAIREGLPPGLLGAGGAWHVFYSKLPRDPRIIAYVSSVADRSGGNDTCTPEDRAVPLDSPAAESWSATRWISRVAREYGYPVSGENPGWGQPGSFGDYYTDLSPRGMMASAVRQAVDCEFVTFYWAHDRQLWDDTVPFEAFAQLVAASR